MPMQKKQPVELRPVPRPSPKEASPVKGWAPERQLPVRLPVALFDLIQRECFEKSIALGRRYSMAEHIRGILASHYSTEDGNSET